jgi:glucose/arabinose dehydrogenase
MPPATAPQSASIADSDAAFIHDALLQLAPPEPVFNPTSLPLDKLTLPPGFTVSVFAVVTGARSLAMAPDGTVFVGTGGFSDVDPDGRVTAIRDVNGDGKIDATGESWVIARSLDNPNGVAFLDGDLYVAEEFELIRFPDILNHLSAPPSPVSVSRDFPTNPQHSWKYLGVGPDKKLYVPVGSPCNICNPEAGTSAGKFSRIFRLNFNAQRTQVVSKDVVAKGVRNTVGFDWDPTTNELWFTDNGRDNIEDDLTPDARRRLISELGIVIPPGEILNNLIPPDELNHVVQEGSDFGFPRCFGKKIKDPRFGTNFDCSGSSQVVPSQVDLQGHAAALGMKFYTGGMFPDQFKNQAFIAEHGSWNSTPGYPKGYKVSLVRFDPTDHSPISYEPFLSGFAYLDGHDEVVWGRPVDILVQADGAILVSDDHAGVIYRIAYSGQ